MQKMLLLALVTLFLVGGNSCKRDEIDINKISNRISVEQQIAAPLFYGEITIDKLIEDNKDTLLIIDGDTVKLVISQDSIVNIAVKELLDIPDQVTTDYLIVSPMDIPLPPVDRIQPDTLINDTLFSFTLANSMRIDSLTLRTGNLVLDVENSFNHTITLLISSVSLLSPQGVYLQDSIVDILPGQTRRTSFNINNYTVQTVIDDDNQTAISVKFTPVIIKNQNDDFIREGDRIDITFGIDQIDDFDGIFGFFGYLSKDIDTLISDFAPDILQSVEGELSITNPSIRLDYMNSIGISTDLGIQLNLIHNEGQDVLIDLGTSRLSYSDDYMTPQYYGSFLYDETTVSNIDELISFPFPDVLNATAQAETNAGADSATTLNWALYDSELIVGVDIEVPLELKANLTYTDSIKIRDEVNENVLAFEIDYADLHYTFENGFPIGFGGTLILYDSIADIILDTINLNPVGGLLIKPAPVDAGGDVLYEEIPEQKGSVRIDAPAAEAILNTATHIIFKAQLITSDYGSVNSVRVGVNSFLKFHFGIDAKGTLNKN